MSNELLGLVAGGVFGYLIGKDGRPVAADQFADTIRENKPRLYTAVHIDLSQARDKEPYSYSGYSITVQNPEVSSGAVDVSVNEPEAETVDITRTRKLHTPFYRFFVTNAAASGTLVLIVSHTPFFEPICDLSTLVKGVNSGSAVPIAVDADGNMLALMKGEYGGSLKTIATDSQGRMLAVVTDPEDIWGNPHQIGLAEHAARLGSINTFDRRGNVIFLEDFQGSLAKVIPSTNGVGASVSISNQRARHGAFSCKMVTGDVEGDWANVQIICPYPVLGKFGFEIAWNMGDADLLDSIQLWLQLYDGSYYRYITLHWDTTDKDWWWFGSGGWVDLGEFQNLHAGDTLFHITKVVFDFEALMGVRVMSNDKVIDVSAQDCYSVPSAAAPKLAAAVNITAKTNANATAYLGHMIITQNEP